MNALETSEGFKYDEPAEQALSRRRHNTADRDADTLSHAQALAIRKPHLCGLSAFYSGRRHSALWCLYRGEFDRRLLVPTQAADSRLR